MNNNLIEEHTIVDSGDKHVKHNHVCTEKPENYKTEKQEFTIAKTIGFGEALFIDGAIQSSLRDEMLYHKPLVHGSAAFLTRSPSNVLVIGGGEGCVLRELIKYESIETITQIDWDVELVHYFRSGPGVKWNGGAYNDPRVHVVHEDVFSTEETHGKKYDLILVDLCDPDDSSINMVKTLIVRLLGCLEEGGVFLMNGGAVLPSCIGVEGNWSVDLLKFLYESGKGSVFSYKIFVPSYMEPWCLIGISSSNTIGNWSRDYVSKRDISDWMSYGSEYDESFICANDAFSQNESSQIETHAHTVYESSSHLDSQIETHAHTLYESLKINFIK